MLRVRACRALLRGRAFPWLYSLLSSSLLNSATSVCLEVVISIEFTWIEFILLILWSCRCSTGALVAQCRWSPLVLGLERLVSE